MKRVEVGHLFLIHSPHEKIFIKKRVYVAAHLEQLDNGMTQKHINSTWAT